MVGKETHLDVGAVGGRVRVVVRDDVVDVGRRPVAQAQHPGSRRGLNKKPNVVAIKNLKKNIVPVTLDGKFWRTLSVIRLGVSR